MKSLIKPNKLKSILTTICILTWCLQVGLSQEITHETAIYPWAAGVGWPRFDDDMIQHNGKFYWFANNITNGITQIFDDSELPDDFEVDTPTQIYYPYEQIRAAILLEYTPGEGFTDHILFPYGDSKIEDVSFDGDSLLIWSIGHVFAIEDTVISGDIDSLINHDRETEGHIHTEYMSYVIYDMSEDTIIDSYSERWSQRFSIDRAVLDNGYAYIISRSVSNFILFGDTFDFVVPEDPSSPNTHISKLNLMTKELEWSKHIGYSRGSYNNAEEMIFDEDGNVIVLFENLSSSQFDGVYLDSLSGFSDITLYRVSQDGDLLEHLRFNAPWDEPFRDYKLENDGSMNVYGVMQGGQPIKVGKDSFFIESDIYASIAIRVNKEWELEWYKSFPGSARVHAMNTTNSSETLMSVPIIDYLDLGDTTIINEHLASTSRTLKVLLKFDKNGTKIGEPVRFGDRGEFLDLITLGHNRYLFIVEFDGFDTSDFNGKYELVGDTFLIGAPQIRFIEIEGDIFDILNSLGDLGIDSNINVFPNPISYGDALNIDIPPRLQGGQTRLYVFDNSGTIEVELDIPNKSIIHLKTLEMSKGMKHITIINGSKNITKSFIIN